MKFVYNVIDSLPALAWLAKIEKEAEIVNVFCGNKVETKVSYFVAGVWDGDFNSGDFDKSKFPCCTGGMLTEEGVKFLTPIHLQESIFSIECQDVLFVSNSLAFILNESQSELNPYYKNYISDMCSILYGYDTDKLVKCSPLKNDRILNYHRCCCFYVNKVLFIREEIRKSGLSFVDFNDYKSKVVQILEQLCLNAQHDDRKHKYYAISTISRGYDAPSASVLAKYLNCSEVITFSKPEDDDGEEIAAILGYEKIYKIDSKLYLKNENYLEAEGAASGGGGATFLGLENLYQGKLLIMGSRGDSLFERLHKNVNDTLDFHEGNMISQATLTPYENLFRNNSVVVPLPMIGVDRWSELARISNSNEMKAWSIGNDYDRPIPRRLLEESGVKREMFGQDKKGAGVSFSMDTLSRLRSKMSSTSYDSLLAYNKTFPKKWIGDFFYKLQFYKINFPIYANFILSRLGVKLHFSCKSKKTGMLANPYATMMLCWGIDKVRDRYKR